MFQNEFQGGTSFEVFSAQGKYEGKEPISRWKVSGSSGIRREFDKGVKGFVYIFDGPVATTKIQMPKENKQSLGLIQKYLLLQVLVPKGQDFSIEIGVQDMTCSKRRLLFSTTYKETQTTPLHSKMPLGFISRDKWLNLVFDMISLIGDTWRGQTYKLIDSLCISACCRLRRVFTMRGQPHDTTDDDELYGSSISENGDFETVPKNLQLAADVLHDTQVISRSKILSYERKTSGMADASTGIESVDLSSSILKKSGSGSYHIAFGTKIASSNYRKASSNSSRDGSAGSHKSTKGITKSRPSSGSDIIPAPKTSRLPKSNQRKNMSHERKNSDPGFNGLQSEVAVDKGSLRTSKTWTDGADGLVEIPFVRGPHPPSEPSTDVQRRRKPRIKSADKRRTASGSTIDSGGTPSQGLALPTPPSSRPNSNTRVPPANGRVVASDQEVADIMAAMHNCQKSESGSEHGAPTHSSGKDFDSDSLTDVIETLQKHGLQLQDYEETDSQEEEDDNIEELIYMYSSPPKTPNTEKAKKKNKRLLNKHRKRRKAFVESARGAKPESDFTCNASSDDERLGKSTTDYENLNSSHSMNKETSQLQGVNRLQGDAGQHLGAYNPDVYDTDKIGNLKVPAPKHGGSPLINRSSLSPAASPSRISISRKSVQEIPQDDIRLSHNHHPNYNPQKYKMEDLSDSFEQNMLAEMKREQFEEGLVEVEVNFNQPQQKSPRQSLIDRYTFGKDPSSSEDEDTPRTRNRKLKNYNYFDEMQMAPATLHGDFFAQSNPRNWGNVFSPPVVPTSEILKDHMEKIAPSQADLSPLQFSKSKSNKKMLDTSMESDDDDKELELLYDPVLQCYYDPITGRYYELR